MKSCDNVKCQWASEPSDRERAEDYRIMKWAVSQGYIPDGPLLCKDCAEEIERGR
jgi:hypothetical protein